MSRLTFQSKIVLTSYVEITPSTQWEFTFNFSDHEGVYLATDIVVGDVFIIDTSPYEIGTLTRYVVDHVVSITSSSGVIVVNYDTTNNNLSVPDLSYSIGLDGVITRPSTNYKLVSSPSAGIQLISDKFAVYLTNYNFNSIVDKIVGGGGSTQVLTSSTPTPTTIGGIVAGTTFDNIPVDVVLRNLLYPYQLPTFTSFVISGQSTALEVGQQISTGVKLFTWTTTNPTNIAVNSITIQNITGGVTALSTNLVNDGSESISISQVSYAIPTTHIWRIQGTNTNTTQFTRDFSVTWQHRRYYGESVDNTLTETTTKSLRVNGLTSGFAGTYAFAAGGYKWITYPSSLGTATTFKDTSTNLDVPFQSVVVLTITNSYGLAIQYNLHRTLNVLGAAISILVG